MARKARVGTRLNDCGMKVCSRCAKEKPGTEFSNVKSARDGKDPHCKSCKKEQRIARLSSDPDYEVRHRDKYMQENKEKIIEYRKNYYQERKSHLREVRRANRDVVNEKMRHYRTRPDVRAKRGAYDRFREISKKNKVPPWLSDEQKEKISEIYVECAKVSKTSGVKHHVDHIVPLGGANVSGLHVPWNLQIVTVDENLSKGFIHYGDDAWPVDMQMRMRAERRKSER